MIYLIVSALKLSELEYQVNDHIKAGYAPNSGMAVGPDGIFHQSMIHTQRFIANFERIEKESNDNNSV